MPQINLTIDYETMDQITVANLKETHAMILKYEDHNEEDDAMLRAIEDVIQYYSSPKDFEEWHSEVVDKLIERLSND